MRKIKMTSLLGILSIGAWLVAAGGSVGQADEPVTPTQGVEADNTGVNRRDRNPAEPTADQARNNLPDREIMRLIRKAIVEDKSLSTAAHNVKIIAQNGQVTLKGPVNTVEEKSKIEKIANEVAGNGQVISDISVKGS